MTTTMKTTTTTTTTLLLLLLFFRTVSLFFLLDFCMRMRVRENASTYSASRAKLDLNIHKKKPERKKDRTEVD